MTGGELIAVEVAYALPAKQWLLKVDLPQGSTVRDAVERSGLAEQVPGLDLQALTVGVWNKAASWDQPLRAGDRVELYRELIADPKEARRKRARTS